MLCCSGTGACVPDHGTEARLAGGRKSPGVVPADRTARLRLGSLQHQAGCTGLGRRQKRQLWPPGHDSIIDWQQPRPGSHQVLFNSRYSCCSLCLYFFKFPDSFRHVYRGIFVRLTYTLHMCIQIRQKEGAPQK